MERWEQSLASLATGKVPFPWKAIYVNVAIEEFDEAWRRLSNESHIDAWDLKMTKPLSDDRPGHIQYHLRGDDRSLIGIIDFSRVKAEQTRFEVTTSGKNDRAVMAIMVAFISNYLAERNWDVMLEQNITELEALYGAPLSNAPQTLARPRWQPRAEADRWLICEYFDVYHEKKALAYFKAEWLRRRREELINDTSNPDNSMAQIIAKERRVRGGE